ncbi:ABC transporter substrate-binding protein [Phytoactinopolyspora endophytica]|uniref:ABC transporter substrate-binding protein n=1 Tax=Phytoactinopolyspora endophytica TaxID=1642495 RepID=UPI00101E175A|nr:ABC transporter substrate-binding protein [Phytoactinopolyspora endophytica]
MRDPNTVSRRRVLAGAATSMTVAVIAGACGIPGEGGDDDLRSITIVVTQAAWTSSYAPLAAADELGYFEDEGLTVEWVNFPGGATSATQLQQGAADVAIAAPEPVVIGHENGEFTAQYYAMLFRRTLFGVATFEGGAVQTAADLEGARVGVVSLASNGVYVAKAVAAEAGVDPESLQFVEIGAGPQAIAALGSDAVDVLSTYDSQYQTMLNAGVEVEVLESDFVSGLNAGGLMALPERLQDEPELFAAIGRAVFKGVASCEQDPEECVRLLWEFDPSTKSVEVSEEEAMANDLSILQRRMEGSYSLEPDESQWGSHQDGTWQVFVDYMVESGQIQGDVDVDGLYTHDLVDEMNDWDESDL